MIFAYEPVTLDVDSGDQVGLLVFREGRLLAIIARLGALHEQMSGWWFPEFVFHPRIERPSRPFPDRDALEHWLRTQLG